MRWFALFACIAVVVACARQPDADAIRAAITEMADAAQARDSADLLARISDDFTANDGEVDRAQLANLLRAQLLGRGAISVSLGTIEVELSGDRATARFDATVKDPSGRWLDDHSKALQFVTGWRREHGTWRCYNANWSGAAH